MLQIPKDSLRWALEQARNVGDTDIFPKIFEFKAIDFAWDEIGTWLAGEDVLRWAVRDFRRCLTPKHHFGFRISTQLDPLDFLVFTALVYEMGSDIEARRVPIAEQCVYSYRFDPQSDGEMFRRDTGYSSFVLRSRQLAEGGSYGWVVVADIADFFPRLYSHRIENALAVAVSPAKANHARAVSRLLHDWNAAYSYGIPVGSPASRLIAEIALDDVDRALLSENAVFVRYSDDFRIFCKSQREAYERLASLANVLFENHGLTLQQHKTRIIPIEVFQRYFLRTEDEMELDQFQASFEYLVAELGLENPYGPIEWEDLSDEQRVLISQLNLQGLLTDQLKKDEVDVGFAKFTLRRLAQLKDDSVIETVLDHIDKLYPVIPQVMEYLAAVGPSLDVTRKVEVGGRLLEILEDSIISHLEFHRMWILMLFAGSNEWNHARRFVNLLASITDQVSQRALILALARSGQDAWFRSQKRSLSSFPAWVRRAVLYGGSCLPRDERRHWYQAWESRLDPLERAIAAWAKQSPIT